MLPDYLMAIGAAALFIAYPIFLRLELNYYKKHRKELTHLLYEQDPFESEEKLYWTDHMIMSVGIFFGLHMAWRRKKNMRVSKEGLLVFAPNIMENDNYITLSINYPYLKKLQLAHFLIGVISFGSICIAYVLKT